MNPDLTVVTEKFHRMPAKEIKADDLLWLGGRQVTVTFNVKNDVKERVITSHFVESGDRIEITIIVPKDWPFQVSRVHRTNHHKK